MIGHVGFEPRERPCRHAPAGAKTREELAVVDGETAEGRFGKARLAAVLAYPVQYLIGPDAPAVAHPPGLSLPPEAPTPKVGRKSRKASVCGFGQTKRLAHRDETGMGA